MGTAFDPPSDEDRAEFISRALERQRRAGSRRRISLIAGTLTALPVWIMFAVLEVAEPSSNVAETVALAVFVWAGSVWMWRGWMWELFERSRR